MEAYYLSQYYDEYWGNHCFFLRKTIKKHSTRQYDYGYFVLINSISLSPCQKYAAWMHGYRAALYYRPVLH